jgi:hypothetical protein
MCGVPSAAKEHGAKAQREPRHKKIMAGLRPGHDVVCRNAKAR